MSGGGASVEAIDFENAARYQLAEKIEELQNQVKHCSILVDGLDSNKSGLQGLADQVAALNNKLVAAAGGKVKKKRAPWGSKKKNKE